MIAVSNDFKIAMKQPIKQLDAYVQIDENNVIRSSDDLISFKISCDTGMCKTAMRKIEGKVLGSHNLLDKWIHSGFGVKLSNGEFEYLDYGSFLITQSAIDKETNTTTFIGYDKMINSMVDYEVLNVSYPISLYDYTQALCLACELELKNTTFIHSDWQITRELWQNIEGITYRDIFVEIAQVTASTCIISDDKVYFKAINNTSEQLTYANMKKLKLEPKYGEINSVVLARDPIVGEDVFLKDDASIETNGLTEFKISNNEIVDKNREDAIEPIYDALHGISYYPFETSTEGLGWYEIADSFDIVDDNNNTFNTILFNFAITLDGGIKEMLKASAETKTQAQYQYASKVEKRIKNTEIIVNKQEGVITSLTEETNVIKNELNNNYYTISQTNEMIQSSSEGVTNTFSEAGGNNVLRNTGLWFEDNSKKEYLYPSLTLFPSPTLFLKADSHWEYWNGYAKKGKNDKASLYSSIILQKGFFKQDQEVPNGNYTISFFYTKLNSFSNPTVTINDNTYDLDKEETTQFITGKQDENGNYLTMPLEVTSGHIAITFYTDINDSVEIYDLMANRGTVKLAYSQNENEVTTDTVNISKGITITSNVSDTRFKANSDGIRILNKNSEKIITDFTDKGLTTKEAIIEDEATIVKTLVQDIDNQTWFTRI